MKINSNLVTGSPNGIAAPPATTLHCQNQNSQNFWNFQNKNPMFTFCKYIKSWPILILTMAQTAFAISHVAVLELLPNESVQSEIKIEESRHLTDELRRQAVMNLPTKDYSVLTRDNIIALIPADEAEAECLAESCAVEIGRAIGAEYISQGTIGKFGSKLTISVELYETMNAKLLASIVFESENIDGLLNVIRNEAKPLFQKILESSVRKPVLPEPKPEPTANPWSEQLSEPKFSELKNSQNNTFNSVNTVNSENSGSDKGMRLPQWLGIGLAVAGIGAGVYGILQNSEYKDLHKDYMKADDNANAKWQDVKDAESRRNIGYIIGGALLASGITVWFVF